MLAQVTHLLGAALLITSVGSELSAYAQTPQEQAQSNQIVGVTLRTSPDNPLSKASNNQNKLESLPTWRDLEPDQKIALAPLQKLWPKMSEFQKQKWLVISQNFVTMGTDEQSRLQSRMNDWVSLSNQERAVARLNFAEVNKLSDDQKRVKWEAYQALEPDAKQKLLDATQPLPKGAAIAVRPTNKSLLTITPGNSTSHASANLPRIDVSQISPKTLLALPKPTHTDKLAPKSAK